MLQPVCAPLLLRRRLLACRLQSFKPLAECIGFGRQRIGPACKGTIADVHNAEPVHQSGSPRVFYCTQITAGRQRLLHNQAPLPQTSAPANEAPHLQKKSAMARRSSSISLLRRSSSLA